MLNIGCVKISFGLQNIESAIVSIFQGDSMDPITALQFLFTSLVKSEINKRQNKPKQRNEDQSHS